MTWLIRRSILALCVALSLSATAFAQAPQEEGEYQNDIDRILATWRTDQALAAYQGACDLPRASVREKIVMLSAYGSGLASNVTLSTQDVQYRVSDIAIERGREPIYLILVSEGEAIWRFTGATRRLRTLVLVSQSPNGYVGAHPQTFRARSMLSCFGAFGEPELTSTMVASGIVARELGRTPDVMAYQRHSELSIPGGVQAPPPPFTSSAWPPPLPPAPPGFDRAVWEAGFPRIAELAMLDPADVRGAQATPYEIMPGWMGLAQLAGNGALEAMPSANDGWQNLRVRRSPLTLPPNVSFRDYTIRLYLPPNMPFPKGDLTGVCMVDEASGDWVGPIAEFCAERHAWMRGNIEQSERARRAEN